MKNKRVDFYPNYEKTDLNEELYMIENIDTPKNEKGENYND
jgi:hypothetical protein